MNQDYRAKNIGQPPPDLKRRNNWKDTAYFEGEIRQFEADRAERLKGRVYRPIIGARVSEDFGNSWKLFALCDECVKSIDVPKLVKREGAAGVQTCDWCGALNEMYRKG